jgi:hypothetical protein
MISSGNKGCNECSNQPSKKGQVCPDMDIYIFEQSFCANFRPRLGE